MGMAGHRLQYLTANDWVLIQARAVRRTYELGDPIIREGVRGDGLSIILRGEAAVELAGAGSRAVVAQLGPGDVCGDMAFLEQGKASATVVARDEQVEVDQIAFSELSNILDAFPGLASRFYHSLALVLVQRLRSTSAELAREMARHKRKS
jgi:CRP-like cAMP-binding protein